MISFRKYTRINENFGNGFNELYNIFGDDCISDEELKPCYGKPCACMVCRHEEFFVLIILKGLVLFAVV